MFHRFTFFLEFSVEVRDWGRPPMLSEDLNLTSKEDQSGCHSLVDQT